MAKRKRLTQTPTQAVAEPMPPLETKAMFPLGVARHAPPIAGVARDSAAHAALEEMTQRWEAARDGGRLVLALPHDALALDHLTRDRIATDAEEMTALRDSLEARGQQTPIEVVALPEGRYGLLSGWRRCQALRMLHTETGEARFATVQALLRRPAEAADAYRTMVDENEIRANLSHFERARIVVKAAQTGVFEDEATALAGLFGTVPRARRSKIRSFISVVHALDGEVQFPERISERLGLDLSQRLDADTGFATVLRAALAQAAPADASAEQSVLKRALSAQKVQKDSEDEALIDSLETHSSPLIDHAGIRLHRAPDGTLLLSGSGVTEDLTRDLVDWIATRKP